MLIPISADDILKVKYDFSSSIIGFNRITVLELFKDSICRFWVAGGSALSTLVPPALSQDIDLYFPNEVNFFVAESIMLSKNYSLDYENKNAKRYSNSRISIDLVKNHFFSPEECLKSFDFKVCSLAYDKD